MQELQSPMKYQLWACANSWCQMCRYQQYKAALEELDSDLASNSSLPTVYQWESPIDGPIVRCVPA